jgi:copper chaperone CopZ
MTTTVLHIDGMSCQNCVRHVTEALAAVDGVQSVTVSLEQKTATVTSAEPLSVSAATLAVEDAGYSLRP